MNFKFDGSRVYFTSDTHFNHANIIRYCQRPFKDVTDMNEAMIANWNRTVGDDDIVFHLGDFCLGGAAEWTQILDRLNGKIYLILGNHDLKNIRQGFIGRFEHVAMQMHIEVGKKKYISAIIRFSVLRGDIRLMSGSSLAMCIHVLQIPELMPDGYNIYTRHNMT